MIAEFGLAALWLAAALAGLQLFASIATLRGGEGLAGLTRPLAILQGVLTALSFAALMLLFIRTDLSVKLVVANSHSAFDISRHLNRQFTTHCSQKQQRSIHRQPLERSMLAK